MAERVVSNGLGRDYQQNLILFERSTFQVLKTWKVFATKIEIKLGNIFNSRAFGTTPLNLSYPAAGIHPRLKGKNKTGCFCIGALSALNVDRCLQQDNSR